MRKEMSGYGRYGLSGNPFRDLSSENLEDVAIYHVNQSIDADLASLRDETLEMENKAVVVLLGNLGAGKTERLLLLKKEALNRDAFCVIAGVGAETQWAVQAILESIVESVGAMKRKGPFGPKWLRQISKVIRRRSEGYDPDTVGRAIAEALNDNAPSFLLINDLHRLPETEDIGNFMEMMYVIANEVRPGVMVLLSGDERYFKAVIRDHPSLRERINRTLVVPPLSDHEASLMIAKRLLAKRLVDDLDSLYPFTAETISIMNAAAEGNPRLLLKYADVLIDNAVRARAVQIDGDLATAVFENSGGTLPFLDRKGAAAEQEICPTGPVSQ